MSLHRLLYRSLPEIMGSQGEVAAEVARIVEASRETNAREGVSGALLVAPGVFMQVIEGPLPAVERTFERICGDIRHRHVQLIDFTCVEQRSFPEWPLAALAPAGELVRLCASLEAPQDPLADPTSASATIQLMRAMALAGGKAAQDRTAA